MWFPCSFDSSVAWRHFSSFPDLYKFQVRNQPISNPCLSYFKYYFQLSARIGPLGHTQTSKHKLSRIQETVKIWSFLSSHHHYMLPFSSSLIHYLRITFSSLSWPLNNGHALEDSQDILCEKALLMHFLWWLAGHRVLFVWHQGPF